MGQPLRTVNVSDLTLDQIQKNVGDVLAQLEEARRGLLVGTVFVSAAAVQLGEHCICSYIGAGAQTWTLPPANLRGALRGQVLFVINAGGGTLTLVRAGKDTVNGGSSVTVATSAGAVLVSDGQTAWRKV